MNNDEFNKHVKEVSNQLTIQQVKKAIKENNDLGFLKYEWDLVETCKKEAHWFKKDSYIPKWNSVCELINNTYFDIIREEQEKKVADPRFEALIRMDKYLSNHLFAVITTKQYQPIENYLPKIK